MNYEKVYNGIIQKAKGEDRKKGGDVYYERHHIIPRCLGGDNSKENLVLLMAREHYICHKLLVEFYPSNSKLVFSLNMMVNAFNKRQNRIKISSREYERLKQLMSISISELHKGRIVSEVTRIKISKNGGKGMLGKFHTTETKNRIGELNKGNKHSDQTKKLMSEQRKGVLVGEKNGRYGVIFKHSEESKLKMSKSKKGVKLSEFHKRRLSEAKRNRLYLTCSHCGVKSNSTKMKLYHFDNCKNK